MIIIAVVVLLGIMVLGFIGLLYDKYRIKMYKHEKMWEKVKKHEASRKEG
ncbi:hypothetical protein [Priestia megaterium]|nr:hypothetical protein [Priestia megaterium]